MKRKYKSPLQLSCYHLYVYYSLLNVHEYFNFYLLIHQHFTNYKIMRSSRGPPGKFSGTPITHHFGPPEREVIMYGLSDRKRNNTTQSGGGEGKYESHKRSFNRRPHKRRLFLDAF